MRCYFNLTNGDRFFIDHDGIEVANLDQAHGEALEAIREISQQDDGAEFDWRGWDLSVVDPAGRVLLSMSLEEAIGDIDQNASCGSDITILQ